MRDTDHSFPLSTHLPAFCFHTSIVATERQRDSLVVKKVEKFLLKHKTPGKKLKDAPPKKIQKKKAVFQLPYHCHLVPTFSNKNMTDLISK